MMSSVQAAVRALASEHREPHDLCGRLNRLLCDSTADDRYITFFFGVLDTTARTLTDDRRCLVDYSAAEYSAVVRFIPTSASPVRLRAPHR